MAFGGPVVVGMLRGEIDVAGSRAIEAQDIDNTDAPVCLHIYVEGRLIGEALANLFGHDLGTAGIGDGHHALVFTPPAGTVVRMPRSKHSASSTARGSHRWVKVHRRTARSG